MLSIDTSYSKNVQWPLSQLLAFHPTTISTSTTTITNNNNSNNINIPAPVHTTVNESTEWVTFAEFEKLHPVPRREFYWPLSTSAREYKNDALSGASRVYVRLNNDSANAGSVGESAQVSNELSVSAKNSTRSPRAGFEVVFEPYLTASEDETTTGKCTVK